ncbi:MAG: HAD-IIIA family hydrolase [Clostridiales Family XIII bacterium]|jgi:histidinol-phosphate phosphatase family protein|nr:HAD-IIIA family hydrolase [Clostridiales Family XIII bacterium]
MRAVILAGGKGTRIKSLYPGLPKPMIPILGKPLLQYQIESLTRQGITDICLILGYRADVIQTHFGDGEAFGAKIEYIAEDEPLGTGGALSLLPREDTLILFGDVYFEVDFNRFICFHREKRAEISLFTHPNSHPYDSDIVAADEENRMTAWKSKKDKNRGELRNLVNAGLYVFSGDALPTGRAIRRDLDHDLILPALPTGTVCAYRSTEYVKDMGTPERLAAAEKDIRSGAAAARSLENNQRAVFLDRDGTINELRGLIDSPEQIELIPGAAEAITMLNASPFLAICVTNQPVVARGMTTLSELDAIHARLDTLLGCEGAYLDDLLYCPHHPDKGYPEEAPEYKIECDCRKPKPGLLIEAAKRYNIDLSRSYMIGDSTADIAAGKTAGCATIGVRTGEKTADRKYPAESDRVCDDLISAVKTIITKNQNKLPCSKTTGY